MTSTIIWPFIERFVYEEIIIVSFYVGIGIFMWVWMSFVCGYKCSYVGGGGGGAVFVEENEGVVIVGGAMQLRSKP